MIFTKRIHLGIKNYKAFVIFSRSKYFQSVDAEEKKNNDIKTSKNKYPDSDFTDEDIGQEQQYEEVKTKNPKRILGNFIKSFKTSDQREPKPKIEYLKVCI